MPRGRRVKAVKPPSTRERFEKLHERILTLREELENNGFGKVLPPPGHFKLIAEPITDPKVGAIIGHVEEPLGVYIQRVSVVENLIQRPPFNHVEDPIYRRLIRDFIGGAVMPESKVAALSQSAPNQRVENLDEAGIRTSLIDGLQRLYCYNVALLLVFRREALVADGCISQEAWDYFKELPECSKEDVRSAVEALLKTLIRYEIFYKIDLAGLLHFMVTFNTGQRRMSLPVQMEIMRRPLIEELERNAKIPVYRDIERLPGATRPKDKFAASDLVLATHAFITNNPQVTAGTEAERFLDQDQSYLENVGDITDVVTTLRRIAADIHPEILRAYAEDPNKRYILSAGGSFLFGLAAACGYIRNRVNMKAVDAALDKLLTFVKRPADDPLKLDEYYKALERITTSRGKAMRRLVDDTFRRFFTGATMELEWLDTVNQIVGPAL